MSDALDIFADALAELQTVHGKTWTFGTATFSSVPATLQPNDPRMQGAPDRAFLILVNPADLPSPRPIRGQEITSGGVAHRVIRVDDDPATGFTAYLLSLA